MKLFTRGAAVIAVTAASVLLAGCQSSEIGRAVSGGPGTVGVTEGSVGGTDCPSPTTGSEVAAPAADAEAIISVSDYPTWIGLKDTGLSVVVYSDGTVVRPPARDRDGVGQQTGLRPLEGIRIDECLTQQLISELDELTPPDGDFGPPRVTDDVTTTVQFRKTDGSQGEHSAYSLRPDSGNGLTPEQRTARERLLAVIGLLRSELPVQPLPIDRVQIVADPEGPPPLGLRRVTVEEPEVWPLDGKRPEQLTAEPGSCVLIDGEDARILAAAVTVSGSHPERTEVRMQFPGETEPLPVGIVVPFPGFEC